MAAKYSPSHYANLTFCYSSRYEEVPDSDSTRHAYSPKTSRVNRSIPHTVYDMLKTLDPELPALPSFLRDEQAVCLLEVAVGVIAKRAKRTEEELRQMRVDYDRLRVRGAEAAHKTTRALSHASQLRLRRAEDKETELLEANRKIHDLQQNYQRIKVQLELADLRMLELKEVKGQVSSLLQDLNVQESTVRSLSEANKDLRVLNQALESQINSLKEQLQVQVNSGQATERTMTHITAVLEKERALVTKERSALLRAKRDWIRTRPDQESRLQMAWEDLRAHWVRLDDTTVEVLMLQEGIQTQKENVQEEQNQLETTAQYLESWHQDLERKDTKSQRVLEQRQQQLEAQEISLNTKEAQLRQLEYVLHERMQSLHKLERALRRREEQLEDRSWQFSTEVSNIPTLQESPVTLLCDLTPRDVITPVSTEDSPR